MKEDLKELLFILFALGASGVLAIIMCKLAEVVL